MPSVVYRAQGTKLQVTIASTLTTVVGLKDISVTGQDVEFIEEGGFEDEIPVVLPAGTLTVGEISGQLIWDPLDPTQQFLHARKNDRALIVGNIIWGNSGVEEACSFYVEKIERSAERSGGLMADVTFKLATKITLNEADPD